MTLAEETTWQDLWFSPKRFGILLALLLAAWFPRAISGAGAFFYFDYGVLGYPFISFYKTTLLQGHFPFWNPYSNCGSPYMAQWGTMAFYPLNLIFILLPLPWSLNLFCIFHLWLAGFGMYRLACGLCGNRFAASAASVAFVFNGITMSMMAWPNYLVALALLPWVLWKFQTTASFLRGTVGLSFLAAMQMLAGVPEMVVFTWILLTVMAVARVWEDPQDWKITVGLLVSAGAAILFLTAIQTLPFLDLLAHSQRHAGFAGAKWSLPAWGWANLVLPFFHAFRTPEGIYYQFGQEFFSSVYLGAGTFLLAALAFWKPDRLRICLAITGFTALLLAFGENGALYPFVRSIFPAIGFARYTVKFLVVLQLVIPLLAGLGLARIESRKEAGISKFLALVILLALAGLGALLAHESAHPRWFEPSSAFLTNGWMRIGFLVAIGSLVGIWMKPPTANIGKFCSVALLILMWADFKTQTPSQNPTLDPSVYQAGLWQLRNHDAPPDIGNGRVFITKQAEELLLHISMANLTDNFLGKRLALWSNLNLLEKAPKVNGSSTLQLKPEAELQKLIYDAEPSPPPGLLDFLGVQYITAANPVDWTKAPGSGSWLRCGQRPEFVDDATMLARLLEPGVDLRQRVFLPLEARGSIQASGNGENRVVRQHFGLNGVAADVESDQPTIVTMAQSYYHKWHAFVDGKETPVYRANYAFVGVEMPAGHHILEFRYVDRDFVLGAVISGIAWLSLLSLWIWNRRTDVA